ncbi:MAG: IS4 family transposase [Bacilli bacterium]|nr:IS4 family transposase [Bacilli bacterium]
MSKKSRITITPNSVKSGLFDVISFLSSNISDYVKNPDKDMTRHRVFDLKTILSIMMGFSSHRLKTELIEFFGIDADHIPTSSALTQQRGKLQISLFEDFLTRFNQKFPFTKVFNGYHLLAVDGSDENLPTDSSDSEYRMKMTRSDDCYYQAHLNAMFDINENRYTDLVIQSRPSMNENKAFCTMVDRNIIPGPCIFIADRGYATFNNIAHVLEAKQFFLIRVKSPASSGSFLKWLIEPGCETDKMVHFGVTYSRNKIYTEHPQQYKKLKKDRTFDFIPDSDTTSVYYMDFRCVCIRLESGEYEYLVTNLPSEDFDTNDLKELYHLRWGIETSFRSLKYALSLSYLHSKKRENILQEIYTKLVMYNFTSLIHSCAQEEYRPSQDKKHEYKVAFDNAFAVTKEFLTKQVSDAKIKNLLFRNTSRVTTNQKHPRKVRSQSNNPLNSRA